MALASLSNFLSFPPLTPAVTTHLCFPGCIRNPLILYTLASMSSASCPRLLLLLSYRSFNLDLTLYARVCVNTHKNECTGW